MTTNHVKTWSTFWSEWGVITALASLKLTVHLATNTFGGYGYFRDELYYLACSEHLSAGYVDQPPLSIFILALNRLPLGDSLFALRLLPAVAGAATVFLAGAIVRELGGKAFAQGFACLAVLIAPVLLAMNTFYSMNALDILLWALAALALIRLLKTENPRYWLILGLVLGLGLLNKAGVLWLGFGIFVGFLLTSQRIWLRTKWPWFAAAMALALFLPFIVWNITHDLAHWEFIQNATTGKYSSQNPLTFSIGQIVLHHPFTLPVWIAGIVFFFRHDDGKFRVLALTFLAAFAILIANIHSQAEYLSSAYTMLFAGGSVALEAFTQRSGWRWLRYAYPALLLSGGLAVAPMALPILPVEAYVRYAKAIGMQPGMAEGKQLEELPQFYADMFGWEEKAKAVADVYQRFSPEDKKNARSLPIIMAACCS